MRSWGKNFGFCGNKDKRGETTQQVTVFKRTPKEVLGACKRVRNMKVGNFRFVDEQLKLGAHTGNEFTIVLRNVVHISPGSTEKSIETLVKESCKSLKTNGFINYYGMQRFGNGAIGTHEVGRMVIAQEWDKVCAALLLPNPFEDERTKKAHIAALNEADVNKLPFRCRIERSVMNSLGTEQPNDWLGAVMRLDRTTRNLYVHAFQSHMWNTVVSRRFRKYGLKVFPGDLIHAGSAEENYNVRIITEEEVERMEITQILMPMVGSMTRFPQNKMKDLYTELFKELKLDESIFVGLDKQWNVKGSYRSMIVRPENFEYKIKRYNDPTDCLLTDRPFFDEDTEKDCSEPTGKHLAVELKFFLPKGAFATMCIRELTKAKTTSHFFKSKNHLKPGDSAPKKKESEPKKPAAETTMNNENSEHATEDDEESKKEATHKIKITKEASQSEPMKLGMEEVPQPVPMKVDMNEPDPMTLDTQETQQAKVEGNKN